MKAYMRQKINGAEFLIDLHKFCTEGPGWWEPFIVETQEEKDYLIGLQFLLGKTYEVCLDGIDIPKRDTPPTWIRIPGVS